MHKLSLYSFSDRQLPGQIYKVIEVFDCSRKKKLDQCLLI